MTTPDRRRRIEDLLRELASPVLAVIARRYQGFDVCEDAVQEALLGAAVQWPVDGIPDNPKGWLITAASRRWIETWRSESARRRREDQVAAESITPSDPEGNGQPDGSTEHDDSLVLFFLCAHPALTPVSQVALTLRAVGGLTTSEIAKALLVPESTVAQRISRAKARIRDSGIRFAMPGPEEQPARLVVVLHVLYLVFNEGYTASSGERLHRIELSSEAIRLTRQLHSRLPHEGEVTGLLALMLLTDARRPARTTTSGSLVPLTEQDRTRWDRAALAEGTALLTAALPHSRMGQYQVQAAIAAVHGEAADARHTDWPQILGLYDILMTFVPGPVVALNRIVALAMVYGPDVGLKALQQAESGLGALDRTASVRAHLLDLAGRAAEAREQYCVAARSTLNLAERQYLLERVARSPDPDAAVKRTP